MKNFEKLQIVVVLISLIAIAVTAVQVATMSTTITDSSQNKYQASADSVKHADSIYVKFRSSKLLANRDIGNFKIKQMKKMVEQAKEVKKVATYWVKTGIKLYKKNNVQFTMALGDKATFNINGKNQKLKIGDKLAVGQIIMKQKYKGSNKFTGNTKLGKEYSGKILAMAKQRTVYVEHFKSTLAIKFKISQDGISISRDLVPQDSGQIIKKDDPKKDDPDDKGGRRRR